MPPTPRLDLALCDALIQRYQPDIDAMTGKGWDHSNSATLSGMANIWIRHRVRRSRRVE